MFDGLDGVGAGGGPGLAVQGLLDQAGAVDGADGLVSLDRSVGGDAEGQRSSAVDAGIRVIASLVDLKNL